MTDDRRMTTDRFYGGVANRLQNLRLMLEYVESEYPPRSELNEWVIANTSAGSQDAVSHHLPFLDAIEIINLSETRCELGDYGEQWLREQDSETLYNALSAGVKGFDTILQALGDGPMTDEEIMDLLVSRFDEAEMTKPGPAIRHREWLQVLGFVEQEDDVNRLTSEGREFLDSMKSGRSATVVDQVEFDVPPVGQRFDQDGIEDWFDTGFGYQISGINPRRDQASNQYVLLFSQEDGPYEDNIEEGVFEYIGEGMPEKGDQNPDSPGNSVLISAVDEPIPIFFFYKGSTDQKWEFRGLVEVLDWSWQTNTEADREEIVFTMQTTEPADRPDDDELHGDLYLIPISEEWLPEFERTVSSALSLELVAETPEELREIEADRIWGTTATDSPKKQKHAEEMTSGDHLLFYYDGSLIARGTVGKTLESEAVGDFLWGNPDSKYIFTVEEYSTETPSIAELWSELGYDGQPIVSGFQRVAPKRLEHLSATTISQIK